MNVEGNIKIGTRTKELIKYLTPGDIAVIKHDNIDQLAAADLINARIKAVINTGRSMTGSFYSRGTAMLINQQIKLFDTRVHISEFQHGDIVKIKGKDLIINNSRLFSNSCTYVNKQYILKKNLEASSNYSQQLLDFLDNTLTHANKERESILSFSNYPALNCSIKGKIVMVIVRDIESEEALYSLKEFIDEEKPILIGVDGGADIIISCGLTPDILIGDMDSVSDVGIYKSRDIILHAYISGNCPCMKRIEQMKVRYKILPMTGTSEDVALLLAYDHGASSIILIGGHSCMQDFLERGRGGMGSTLITRLKVEDKLIDYKSIVKLQALKYKSVKALYKATEGEGLWLEM